MGDCHLAVWAITPNGLNIARKILGGQQNVDLYVSASLQAYDPPESAICFKQLSTTLSEVFDQYSGHVFIMASGIVVRMISDLIRHKTRDPAVVVIDDQARYAISLLSGHLGGANRLANRIAQATGAEAVITTATDVNHVPSVDLKALECGLHIENPNAIKSINMAWLKGQPVALYDPYGLIGCALPAALVSVISARPQDAESPTIVVDEVDDNAGLLALLLRPKLLAVGIGCNRNTPLAELETFLKDVMARFRLSTISMDCIATIDIKSDEPGLLQLADKLGLPLRFYDRMALNQIEEVAKPSEIVKKHVGVQSVCEAAAILAANQGKLIVPKQIAPNVTVAVAKTAYMSSASARDTRITCRPGPKRC